MATNQMTDQVKSDKLSIQSSMDPQDAGLPTPSKSERQRLLFEEFPGVDGTTQEIQIWMGKCLQRRGGCDINTVQHLEKVLWEGRDLFRMDHGEIYQRLLAVGLYQLEAGILVHDIDIARKVCIKSSLDFWSAKLTRYSIKVMLTPTPTVCGRPLAWRWLCWPS